MTRYRAAPDALAATLSDGAVLLNLRTKRYYSLNETGTRIWQLLLEGRTEEEIVQTLTAEYDVEATIANQEMQSVIASLRDCALIEHDPS
ncbi:MAG TPA: PqqD family protein [Gemmatimonadaceae bacterium]|nr:PqqD family protein [Gemmatimonadaceae bacterium]